VRGARPGASEVVKRLLDLSAAAAGLVVLSPVLAFVAVWIGIDSPGPVLYRGRRIGRHGKPFLQLKFRTMVPEAESRGGSRTPDGDPRVSRAGRVLRRWKLDELPQLVNVVRGEMSLVGPRPDVEEYASLYEGPERRILELRPGLTDWATLWYRDDGEVLAGFADPEAAYRAHFHPTKVRLQLDYLRHASITTDLCILALTLTTLFRRRWLPPMLARRLVRLGQPAVLAADLRVPGVPRGRT
jgi:lipopolysaccharide/colanic/teichoic acid biosynthesis glycosyltransferase